jgi:hypothetical protein
MATTNTIDINQLQEQLAKADKTNDTLKKQLVRLEKANVNCTNEKSELLTKFKNASSLHGAQKDSIVRWTGNYTRSDEENKKLLKENETLKKSHESFKEALHNAQTSISAKYTNLTTTDSHYSFENGNEKIKNLVQNFKNELSALYDEIAQENDSTNTTNEL